MFDQNFINLRGALTSKPYAFLARPWEFKSIDSIDIFDGLGSNIRVDVRGDKVLRILPRSNDSINEDWISDRVRFVCDAIRLQRLDTPLIRFDGSYRALSWYQAFSFLAAVFFSFSETKKHNRLAQLYNCFASDSRTKNFFWYNKVGNFLDLDAAGLLNKISVMFRASSLNGIGSARNSSLTTRQSFLVNQNWSGLSGFRTIVLVNFNLKLNSPLVGVRLRGLMKQGVSVYNFGPVNNFSNLLEVGTVGDFFNLLCGRHWLANKVLRSGTFFLFGGGAYSDFLNDNLITFLNKFGLHFGVFEESAGLLSAKEFGLIEQGGAVFDDTILPSVSAFQTNASLAYAARSLKDFDSKYLDSKFKVILASHGGVLAQDADFILPVSTFFEQSKSYLNVLGLKQHTRLSLVAPNNVLDHAEGLLLLLSALYVRSLVVGKLNHYSLLQFFNYLNSGFLIFSNVWVYINKFFAVVESRSISFSSLVRTIFVSDFFVDKKISKSVDNYTGCRLVYRNTKVTNVGVSKPSFSNFDVYLQDEISISSATLTAASKRLNVRFTFL